MNAKSSGQAFLFRIDAKDFMLDEPRPATPIDYGVQPTPTTCPACGAPVRCCGGAKEK